MAKLVRRQNPPVYTDYPKYKPILRQEFNYRCIYCDIHENEHGGPRHFGVEHFRPKSIPRFSHLICVYANLFYACNICNSFKSNQWPSDNPLTDGKGFLDPCEYDYDEHFLLNETNHLVGLTAVGAYMIEILHLNRAQLVKLRNSRDKDDTEYFETLEYLETLLSQAKRALVGNNIDGEVKTEWQKICDITTARKKRIEENWTKRYQPKFDLADFR